MDDKETKPKRKNPQYYSPTPRTIKAPARLDRLLRRPSIKQELNLIKFIYRPENNLPESKLELRYHQGLLYLIELVESKRKITPLKIESLESQRLWEMAGYGLKEWDRIVRENRSKIASPIKGNERATVAFGAIDETIETLFIETGNLGGRYYSKAKMNEHIRVLRNTSILLQHLFGIKGKDIAERHKKSEGSISSIISNTKRELGID